MLFVILIKENIMYGKDRVILDEVIEVVKFVNVFSFINELFEGLEI